MRLAILIPALALVAGCAEVENLTGVPKPILDVVACETIKLGGSILVGDTLVNLATAEIDLIDGCGEVGVDIMEGE